MSMLERMRAMKARGAEPRVPTSKGLTMNEVTREEALAKFGYKSFRTGQAEIIDAICGGSEGVLAVMATGAGKSALFQIPAIMTKHLTIVVSPLIALMKDQVDNLNALGIPAGVLNSMQTPKQQQEMLSDILAGKYEILYCSPERFDNKDFMNLIQSIRVGLFAVDESHCVSAWGHDFRPSYARLNEVIKQIDPQQVVALTATATEKVKEDICQMLGMPDAKQFVRGVKRDNLEVCIFNDNGMSRQATITDAVREYGESVTGIVYVATRKEADSLTMFMKSRKVDAICYHAGLKDKDRKEIQEHWAENGGVVVATSAFGMGIDRSDVRFVIHSGFTGSLEEWYQEIGRAGRDGEPSVALTLWNVKNDYHTQKFLIDLTNPEEADVKKFWRWMLNYSFTIARPNSLTTTVNMTQKDMAQASGCANVGSCISFLKKEGMVETKGRGKYQVTLQKKDMDYTAIRDQRRAALDKLNNLVNFYQSKNCRFDHICKYFGDDSFSGQCNNCDNCQ